MFYSRLKQIQGFEENVNSFVALGPPEVCLAQQITFAVCFGSKRFSTHDFSIDFALEMI